MLPRGAEEAVPRFVLAERGSAPTIEAESEWAIGGLARLLI